MGGRFGRASAPGKEVSNCHAKNRTKTYHTHQEPELAVGPVRLHQSHAVLAVAGTREALEEWVDSDPNLRHCIVGRSSLGPVGIGVCVEKRNGSEIECIVDYLRKEAADS